MIRVLAFSAAHGKEIQNIIADSDVIKHTLNICETGGIAPKLIVAILKLILNVITQNTEKQNQYVEMALCNDGLLATSTPECYPFALIILYNTIATNAELIPVLFNNKKVLRWYKAAFSYIERNQQKSGMEPGVEKVYADVYEWFSMISMFAIKNKKMSSVYALNKAFGCLVGEDSVLHIENTITFVRNSSEDHTVIQPCLLQSRFLQFLCSEIILHIKEGPAFLDEISPDTNTFLCKLLTALSAIFISSYDILKTYQDPFLSLNFAQDFQTIIGIISLFEAWVESKTEDQELRQSFCSNGLYDGCFNIINFIDSVVQAIKSEEALKPFEGIQTKAMKIISNISYKSITAGEYFVSHKHRLGDILRQTKMNFSQPGLREWALLTIRHLCERNII